MSVIDRSRDIALGMVIRLKSMPSLPAIVSYENGRVVDPIAGQPHVREYILPADTETYQLAYAAEPIYSGLYQVDVYVPLGSGRAYADEIAGNVINHFLPGTQISFGATAFNLERHGSIVDRKTEGAYYKTTVRVPYRVVL